jgi:hypothetical protein
MVWLLDTLLEYLSKKVKYIRRSDEPLSIDCLLRLRVVVG